MYAGAGGMSYGAKLGGSKPGKDKSFLILIGVLLCIVVIESVFLTILAIDFFDTGEIDDDGGFLPEETIEELNESGEFTFDNSGNIVAFDITCTSEEGGKYTFAKSMKYKKSAPSGETEYGIYSILKNSAVILKDAPLATESEEDSEVWEGDEDMEENTRGVIYYDGNNIIDGLTFYECVEGIAE